MNEFRWFKNLWKCLLILGILSSGSCSDKDGILTPEIKMDTLSSGSLKAGSTAVMLETFTLT